MKVFRSMRMKLIGDTKFKKYFVYAIGEVALIIIGILIAISINNWSEYKKDRALEGQHLTALMKDLDKDLIKSESALKANKIFLVGIDELLQLLADQKEDTLYWRKIYMHSIKDTYWYMSVDYNESTLGQLINSNGMQLVKDKEISTAILKYQEGLIIYKNQYSFLMNYFHEMEETQKSLFDLRLARRAFLFIEENHTNMLKPISEFQEFVQKGDYVINKDPLALSSYYGDVLYYESNLKYFNSLLNEQNRLALNLKTLIDSKYKITLE